MEILIFFGVLCFNQVFALPAQVDFADNVAGQAARFMPSRSSLSRAVAVKTLADVVAGPSSSRAVAGPAFADAGVQDLSRLAPAANHGLSRAEMRTGKSIVSKLDNILKDPTDTRPGKKRCLNHVDLQLIIDSSGSIGQYQFSKAKNAMKTLVDYVDYRCTISQYGSQNGIIEFSSPSQTHVEFSMGDYTSGRPVKRAIDGIGYDSGYSTATANALRLAITEFNQNGIPSNAKVAWILTDGNSNSGDNPKYVADQLRGMGVMVCAVAIGNNINMSEINEIASDGCAFDALSFTRYEKIMEFAASEGRAADNQSGQEAPIPETGFLTGVTGLVSIKGSFGL